MPKNKSNFTFIDLFAGIGGFHVAFQRLDFECVFASEIDKFARSVYKQNFNIRDEIFNEDITQMLPADIPDHDILCAGFPCQPFSQAGLKRGFADSKEGFQRGNLFFYIAEILKAKRPKAFILENVQHLLKHNDGKTFQTIYDILNRTLNYRVFHKIIKASDFGRPQHRPRIYIVGFLQDCTKGAMFSFPEAIPLNMTMSDVWGGTCNRKIGYTLRVGGRGSPLNDRRNWDGYIVDGKEVRLGPLQAKRMMGFSDDFFLSPSKTQAMKQMGNSVCVDVVYHIAKQMRECL